jgi:hypothetical protein
MKASVVSPRAVQRKPPWGAETPVGPVHVEKGHHVPWGAETPVGPVHVEEVRHVPWGAETPVRPVHVESVHVVALLVVVPEGAAGSAAGSVVVLVAWETTAVVVAVVVAGLFVERSAPAVVVRESAGAPLFGECFGPREAAGASRFGECIGPSCIFLVPGSAAVKAAGAAGALWSAGACSRQAVPPGSAAQTLRSGACEGQRGCERRRSSWKAAVGWCPCGSSGAGQRYEYLRVE